MSVPLSNEDFINPDICEFAEPVDLKQENIQMLQQQNAYTQHFTPPASGISNSWPSNDMSFHIQPEYPNYTSDVQFQAPVIFENGSVSTVLLPLFANADQTQNQNFQNQMNHMNQINSSSQQVNVANSGKEKKQKVKKQFISEQEAILLEKDDAELSEAELTIKKKAQNRLAQRAFRERKELKLKALETKLLESEEERQKLLEKLEEIKLQFITVNTENKFLRNSADQPSSGSNYPLSMEKTKFVFPKSQQEFIAEMVQGGNHKISQETINKVYNEPQNPGRKVLAVGAVWDYLQIKSEEEEFENIDMFEVMTRLKGNELCHGYGPAYPLDLVESALREVVEEA